MDCPDCGYMLSAFDKDCPRCLNIGKPQKSCLKCGTSSGIREIVCVRCTHRFGDPVDTAPEAETSVRTDASHANISSVDRETLKEIVKEVVYSEHVPQTAVRLVAQSHPGRIVMMWLLSLVAWLAFIAGGVPLGLLIDVVSVIIAFTLIGSRSSTDKTNGWIKLALETVSFFVAFVNASNISHQ